MGRSAGLLITLKEFIRIKKEKKGNLVLKMIESGGR